MILHAIVLFFDGGEDFEMVDLAVVVLVLWVVVMVMVVVGRCCCL